MSNPAEPNAPREPDRPTPGNTTATPEGPNPFGPDGPNVRDDDPPGGQAIPEAPPPSPPETPLDEGDFAPDEP